MDVFGDISAAQECPSLATNLKTSHNRHDCVGTDDQSTTDHLFDHLQFVFVFFNESFRHFRKSTHPFANVVSVDLEVVFQDTHVHRDDRKHAERLLKDGAHVGHAFEVVVGGRARAEHLSHLLRQALLNFGVFCKEVEGEAETV